MNKDNSPVIQIGNILCKIKNLKSNYAAELSKLLSVKVPNYWFSTKYQNGFWDGTQKFFLRPANTFPTGLLEIVLDFLVSECEVEPTLIDERTNVEEYLLKEVPMDYKVTESKDSRDYQVDTINKVICKNIQGIPFMRGVINIATNGGKTTIAEGIIKELLPALSRTDKVFLFVTHSKEIARQAKKSIEADLGVETGFIGDGIWDVKNVTIAIITTLYRRIKKDEFKTLSENTIGFVADECLSGNSQVLLPNNKVMSIKDICERDDINEVISYNLEKNIFETKKILRKMITPGTEQFWKIWYEDPITHEMKGLTATRNHKIWTATRGYVRVDELTTDDIIKINISNPEPWDTHNVKICKISKAIGQIPKYKYNLEVEDNHNYIADSILVSNCHHAQSTSWYEVFNTLPNASIRLGLTGTVDKKNPVNEMRLYSCTGQILNKISNDYLIEKGFSAKPICILFTVTSPELEKELYQNAYSLGIVESEERLSYITSICEKEVSENNVVLILVERIEHGELIQEELEKLDKRVFFTNGTLTSDRRQELLDDLKDNKIDVLISTAILDEGVDVSNINAVIYARGMKSTRKLLQGLGRGLRKKSDGSKLRFYDFIDDTNSTLLHHSLNRFEVLKAEKFTIKMMTIDEYKDKTLEEISYDE